MLPEFYDKLSQTQRQLSVQIARATVAETRIGGLLEDVSFWRNKDREAAEREKVLRQRVASLEAQVAELTKRLEKLLQQQIQVQLDELAQGLGQTLEAGQAAMPGRVISQVDATFKGLARISEKGVGLQLTGSEFSPAAAFSQVHLTVGVSPGGLPQQAFPVVARALERLQDVLSRWSRPTSAAWAEKHIVELARLLAARAEWTPGALLTAVEALLPGLREILALHKRNAYRYRCAAALDALTRRLSARSLNSSSATDLVDIAAALQEMAAALELLGTRI